MNLRIGNIKLGTKPVVAVSLTDRDLNNLPGKLLSLADMIELRIDMFKNISPAHVLNVCEMVKQKTGKPVIVTIRTGEEGGKLKIHDDERYRLFKIIIPYADAIDIEINSRISREIVKLGKVYKKIIIGSYHNFKETPDNAFLEMVLAKGKDTSADIIKLALYAKKKDDVARLLSFTIGHKTENIITISMGRFGGISRVINPLFGSLISYTHMSRSTAPGQLHITELVKLLQMINPESSMK